jgi:hypothetical protein
MMNCKVLNDHGRLEDRDTFVFENRELRNRPEFSTSAVLPRLVSPRNWVERSETKND